MADTTRATSPRGLLIALTLLPALSGCGSQADNPARSAAESFGAALRGGDYAGACRWLARQTAERLVDESGSCVAGLKDAGLDPPTITAATVYGHEAMARSTTGPLILALMKDGWRVQAAGCEPTPSGSFDCALEG